MKVCHWTRGGLSEMPRFDVYLNSGAQAAETPYLLDVQSDLLQGLETRIVVPLRRRDRFPVVSLPANLTPTFEIEGVECLLETPKLAAVPLLLLKAPLASLAASHFGITAALDFLFQGY
jgi:toxin CcdB